MGTAMVPSRLAQLEFALVQAGVFLSAYIAFHRPGIYITVSDALLAASLFVRLCDGSVRSPFRAATPLWLAGAAMLIGGLLIGSIAYGNTYRGMIVISQYGFTLLLVPLAVLGRSREQSLHLIKCAVAGLTVMCAIGLAIFASGYTAEYDRYMQLVTGSRRLSGFVDNPNGLAILIVLTFPLLWFLAAERLARDWIVAVCFGILLAGLIATSSNTGIIGLALTSAVFMAGRGSFKALVIAVLCVGALYLARDYLPQTFQERVLTAATTRDIEDAGTFQSRFYLIQESWDMVEDNILIGLGADEYRAVSRYGLAVHNTYLLLLNEGGALSLAGLIVIILTPAGAVLAYRRSGPKTLPLTAITVTLAYVFVLIGNTHIYGRALIVPLLLAAGPALAVQPQLALILQRQRRRASHDVGRVKAA